VQPQFLDKFIKGLNQNSSPSKSLEVEALGLLMRITRPHFDEKPVICTTEKSFFEFNFSIRGNKLHCCYLQVDSQSS